MKNKLAILFIILVSASLYAFTIRGEVGNFSDARDYQGASATGGPFESSHERAPYMQMLSIIDRQAFDLTQEQADFAAPDAGYENGKFYSLFPPGVSLSLIPLYVLGSQYDLGQVFAYATMALFTVLTMVFIFMISRQILGLSVWASIFGALIFGFASTSWGYAITIYQHVTTAFLVIFGFYATWKYKQEERFSWIWGSLVWLVYGISIFVDYPNAFLLLPIMAYFLFSSIRFDRDNAAYKLRIRTALFFTSIVFIGITALHLYHNETVFGNWKKFSNRIPRYQIVNLEELQEREKGIVNQTQSVSRVFQERYVPNGFYRLTVAPDKGIFFFSPIFLLALLGVYKLRRKINIETGILLALIGVNFLVYISFSDPWGGWAYGPRYLVPSMAVLSLFVAFWISRGEIWKKIIAFILFAYSSAIALLGALTTNAVPPKIEADFLGLKYNFFYNLDFFMDGKSGSFLYNTYFFKTLSLQDYFLLIYIALLIVVTVVLFIVPLFETKHESR